MSNWVKYESGERDAYIPTEQWGHDHWSTFAYLESRAVNYSGVIDNRHMRCNARLHRHFVHVVSGKEYPTQFVHIGKEYPTRLRNGEEAHHDDWSCLEDMVAAGLVEAEFYIVRRGKARVKFTPSGKSMVALLRAHKMDGGTWASFTLP